MCKGLGDRDHETRQNLATVKYSEIIMARTTADAPSHSGPGMILLWGGDKQPLVDSNCPLSQPLATSFLGNRSENGPERFLPFSIFLCGSICHDSLCVADRVHR